MTSRLALLTYVFLFFFFSFFLKIYLSERECIGVGGEG